MSDLATAAFRTVGSSDDVPADLAVPFYLDDLRLRIAVARVGDRLHAFSDLCTCGDEPCPLSAGLLEGTTLMCQCHGSRYDISTGAVINGPATMALDVYEAREADGNIQVRV
jgi:nitrite reductase/ring-hydroxylating ferredoxin subunit